jgi:hypothetical protein
MKTPMNLVSKLAGAAMAAGLLACAHTRPEAMSATDHQAEALDHYGRARQHEARFDPGAQPALPKPPAALGPTTPMAAQGADPSMAYWVYNPTEHHLAEAARERAHAEEHARAAARLRQEEAKECAGVAPEARTACPLLAPYVAKVTETPRGVVLSMKPGAPGESIAQLMRCHLAFARLQGFQQAGVCALYVQGSEVLSADGGATLELRGDGPATAADIRRKVREEIGPRAVPARTAVTTRP